MVIETHRYFVVILIHIPTMSTSRDRDMPAIDLISAVKDYVKSAVAVIREGKGHVVQVMGDAILAAWPADQNDAACTAISECHNMIEKFNAGDGSANIHGRVMAYVSVGKCLVEYQNGQITSLFVVLVLNVNRMSSIAEGMRSGMKVDEAFIRFCNNSTDWVNCLQ